MSPSSPKGPRPQRREVEQATVALVEETTGALATLTGLPLTALRDVLLEHTRRVIALVADSGAVTATSGKTPKATRVRRPGHGEDV